MSAWSHSHTRHSRVGDMRCTACNKMIEDCEFRYRARSKRGDWGYVAQHRECSEDDPTWKQMEADREARQVRWAEFVADCKAFRDKWAEFYVTELDDYIVESRNG